MEIREWWSRLDSTAKQWLIDHNGEALPGELVTRIIRAGGPEASDAWWFHQDGSSGLYFPDEAVEWLEATANDESD